MTHWRSDFANTWRKANQQRIDDLGKVVSYPLDNQKATIIALAGTFAALVLVMILVYVLVR